ncbi:MAG: hypothetical protein ACLRV9_01210 [Clostridium sp.]
MPKKLMDQLQACFPLGFTDGYLLAAGPGDFGIRKSVTHRKSCQCGLYQEGRGSLDACYSRRDGGPAGQGMRELFRGAGPCAPDRPKSRDYTAAML